MPELRDRPSNSLSHVFELGQTLLVHELAQVERGRFDRTRCAAISARPETAIAA
jgi:hypothetical protein